MRNQLGISLILAMLLVACAGTPATSPPQGGDATAAPPAGGGGSTAAACDLLTDEDIELATGATVESMEAGPVLGIFENGCEWTLEAGTAGIEPSLTVGVISPGGRRYYESYFEPFIGEEGGHVASLSGIGDKASRDEFGNIMAVKGDTLVDVSFNTYPAPDNDVITPLILAALTQVSN